MKIVNARNEIPESFEGNPRVVKVNLPDNESDFKRGNGEGVWAYIRHEEDLKKYDEGKGDFEVILLNTSVYYMGLLKWGDVILVEGRGKDNRPVLKKEWIEGVLKWVKQLKN